MRLPRPSGLSLPFAFGMYTRRAGSGPYEPTNSSLRIVASACWRFTSSMRLSTPSIPGVRAPLDASVMRAASLSQSLSVISLRSRSNLRSLFSVNSDRRGTWTHRDSSMNASGGYSLKDIENHFRLYYSCEPHSETATADKKQDLTVRSNSSKSSGLTSCPGSCPCALVV